MIYIPVGKWKESDIKNLFTQSSWKLEQVVVEVVLHDILLCATLEMREFYCFSELEKYNKHLKYFNCYGSQSLNQIVCYKQCQEVNFTFYTRMKTVVIVQLHFLQSRNLFSLIKVAVTWTKTFKRWDQPFLQGNQVYFIKGINVLSLVFLHL